MQVYNIHIMDTLKKTWRTEPLLSQSDEHALAMAQQIALSSPMELWCGPRLVKVLPGRPILPTALAFAS